MKKGAIRIRDTKAQFSALADARRLCPEERRSFADLLLSFPGMAFERDATPLREVDL